VILSFNFVRRKLISIAVFWNMVKWIIVRSGCIFVINDFGKWNFSIAIIKRGIKRNFNLLQLFRSGEGHNGPFWNLNFTPLSPTSSTFLPVGVEDLQKAFPSLMVSSYSSYSFPFSPSFFQNLLDPFFPSLLASSSGSLPLCSSSPGHFGLSLFSHA